MHLQPVDLPEVIRDVVQSVALLASEKSLRISMKVGPDMPPALADRLRLEQILTNLLSNAIKFTPEGSDIRVACEREDEMARCSVRDTGIGIPADELPNVFDKFHQVRAARKKKVKGTGLGLTIVKHLVEAHGGEIAVESVVDEGTVFSFTVPVAGDGEA